MYSGFGPWSCRPDRAPGNYYMQHTSFACSPHQRCNALVLTGDCWSLQVLLSHAHDQHLPSGPAVSHASPAPAIPSTTAPSTSITPGQQAGTLPPVAAGAGSSKPGHTSAAAAAAKAAATAAAAAGEGRMHQAAHFLAAESAGQLTHAQQSWLVAAGQLLQAAVAERRAWECLLGVSLSLLPVACVV